MKDRRPASHRKKRRPAFLKKSSKKLLGLLLRRFLQSALKEIKVSWFFFQKRSAMPAAGTSLRDDWCGSRERTASPTSSVSLDIVQAARQARQDRGGRGKQAVLLIKRTKKPLFPWVRAKGDSATAGPKVFCFFSSEKKALLASRPPYPHSTSSLIRLASRSIANGLRSTRRGSSGRDRDVRACSPGRPHRPRPCCPAGKNSFTSLSYHSSNENPPSGP